jgi:N-acetylated-alpha-linked acidic dipeptidase
LLGSTEWAEDHQKLLSQKALAYINVDVGARSSKFSTAAHPLLQDVIHAATKKVVDPNCAQVGNFSTSVYDVWNKRIPTLGSGSDYTVFQDFLGIPSLDMGFSGQDAVSVYHYHSNYDSHAWMSRYGDPGFRYHVAIAKIWGLIALQLSESPVVPFNATSYTTGLGEYLAHIQSGLNASSSDYSPHHPHHPHPPADEKEFLHHLSQLQHSIHRLQVRAKEFDARAAHLADELSKPAPWWRRIVLWWRARTVNQQYKFFDRAFLYKRGLDDRPWFQHLVYAPGKWTGYSGDTFPGLVESVSEKNWTNAVVSDICYGRMETRY